jgi:hypothetical protein
MKMTGISFKYSFLKQRCIFFIIWSLISLLLYFILNDDLIISVVFIAMTLISVSWGIYSAILMARCRSSGKIDPKEKMVVHFHSKMDSAHLLRLDQKYFCKECDSSFKSYLPDYCSKCGKKLSLSPTDTKREKFGFMDMHNCLMMNLYFITLGGGAQLIVFTMMASDPKIMFIIAPIFYLIICLASFIEYVTKNHGNDGKKLNPMDATMSISDSFRYTELETRTLFPCKCGNVLHIDSKFCTKCGTPHESGIEKDNKFWL